MKNKIINSILLVLFFSAGFISCQDWTEASSKDYETYRQTDEYYANLRAWKSTSPYRQVSFGWFGYWSGVGAELSKSMAGIPDSMDIISIWGPWHPYTINENKQADLDLIRKVKGTKVVACSFTQNVGDGLTPAGVNQNELWGWNDDWTYTYTPKTEREARQIEAAVRRYARAFVDSVKKAGLDGFDIDFEGSGNLRQNKERMHFFVDELGKHFGPKSPNPDKLLILDYWTELPSGLDAKTIPYFNYIIKQAYSGQASLTRTSQLDAILSGLINAYKSELTPEEMAAKLIVSEQFEVDGKTGGNPFVCRELDDETVQSMVAYGAWIPLYNGKSYRKGGCGAYHFENNFALPDFPNEHYPHLRQAIQHMNPHE